MKISIRLSLISRLVFFVSSPYPQALNSNNPPWGLIRKGGLFVKSNFRGGGLFESGGLIDHLRYWKSEIFGKDVHQISLQMLSKFKR